MIVEVALHDAPQPLPDLRQRLMLCIATMLESQHHVVRVADQDDVTRGPGLTTAEIDIWPGLVNALQQDQLFPVQKIASGLSGEPVPSATRRGAAENRNS